MNNRGSWVQFPVRAEIFLFSTQLIPVTECAQHPFLLILVSVYERMKGDHSSLISNEVRNVWGHTSIA